jgi:hypothetical protein
MPGRLLLLAAAAAVGCGARASTPADPAQAQALVVQFSHKTHVGDNLIGCGVCHPYARHSPNAGLAPESTCMGCHKFVSKQKPDIQKLAAAFTAGRPLTWTRQHRVPDHVFFSHERHLAMGVGCKACHGEVAGMTLDHKVHELQMGFCMDCHLQKQVTTDCLACHK